MQGDQASLLKTLLRVLQFLDDYAEPLVGVVTPRLRANVVSACDRMRELESVQDARATVGPLDTGERRRLYEAVINEVRVVRSAAALAGLEIPGLAAFAAKSPPRAGARLATRARSIATAAEAHEAALLAAGAPATFIGDLRAAADSLDAAIDAAGRARTQGAAATAGLRAAARDGRTVIAILDALVRSAISDRSVLAAWETASHVDAVRALAKGEEAPAVAAAPTLRALAAGAVPDPDALALPAPTVAEVSPPALPAPVPERPLKRLAETFAVRADERAG